MLDYGKALKKHRQKRGLSQRKLAQFVGISQAKISLWETNKRLPSIKDCWTLADYYGISLEELIGRK